MKPFALLALATLACAGPMDRFVQVSPRNPHYLELTGGAAYIPIGLNMVAPPRNDFSVMEGWLEKLAANHGNYIRVWLSNPYFDVEPETSGVYDDDKAARIDRMLAACRRHGIRVKMTMEHFRTIGEQVRQSWADKPIHHISRGGPAASIADFFDGETSRAQFRRKIAWYAKRYGSRPEIYGWELWNEVNAVRGGNYLAWTRTMLPELHKAFPHNMAMQSLGSYDSERAQPIYKEHSAMPGNDLAQVHRYLDLGARLEVCKGPMDVLAADAVRQVREYAPDRPVLLAESGAVEPRHSGPFKLYKSDRQGMLLHDVLFAPFFAGAAGAGQIWHWDVYVAANDLWWQFGRFAEAVKDIDPVAEQFEPSLLDQPALRVYVLRGRRTTLAWCRDKANTWMSELRDGIPPQVLRGIEVPLRARSARVYDPWKNTWSRAAVSRGAVRLPEFSRSLVVRVKE